MSARAAAIRPLSRGEGEPLTDVMAGLSPRSRYLRFHAATPTLTAGLRAILLDVDGRDHVALVAEIDDRPADGRPRAVGVARLVRDTDAPDEAEVAIAVVDAWHRRGLGIRLLEALAERARALGVSRLHAFVLPENAAALGLVRVVFPARLARREADVIHLICPLTAGQEPEITMDDILTDLTG